MRSQQRVDANPDAVFRLLRTLASRGLFAQQADGRFVLTPMADALRADAPTSVRGFVLFWGDQRHWEHWSELPYAVQTGQPAVDTLRGKPFFDFLKDDPEFAAIFNDGMTSVSDMEIDALLAAYDFTGTGTIVDVGGGHGRLLAAILRKWPQSRGILFDIDAVVDGAPAILDNAGVAGRCSLSAARSSSRCHPVATSMCSSTSCTTGTTPMRWQILREVRAAISSSAKLLIIESVVPDDNRDHLSKLLDLEMLVVGPGRERTAARVCGVVAHRRFPRSPA